MEKDVFKQELWNRNNKLKPSIKNFFVAESQIDLTKLIWQDSLVTEHLKSLVRLKNIKNKVHLQKKSSQKEALKPHINKILLGTDLHKKMMQERYIQLNKARLLAKLPLLRVTTFKKNLKSLSVDKKIVHSKRVSPTLLKKKTQVTKKNRGNWFLKLFKKKIRGLRQFSLRFRAAGQVFNMLKLPIKKKVFKNNSPYKKKNRFQPRAALSLSKKFVKTKLSTRSQAGDPMRSDTVKSAITGVDIEKSLKPATSFIANTDLVQNLVLQQNWLLKNRIVPPAQLLSRWGVSLYNNKLVGNVFTKINTLDKLHHLFRLNIKSTNSLRDRLIACKKIEKNYDPKAILENDDFSAQVLKFLKITAITKIGGPSLWKSQKRRYFRSLLLRLLRGRRALARIKKKRKKRKTLSSYYPRLLHIFDGRLSYARLRSRVANFYFFKLIKHATAKCPRLLGRQLNLNYFINKPKFRYINISLARDSFLVRNNHMRAHGEVIKSKVRSIFFFKLQLISCKPLQLPYRITNTTPVWKIASWNRFFSLRDMIPASSTINYLPTTKSARPSRSCSIASVDVAINSIVDENQEFDTDYNLVNGTVEMDALYPYGGKKWDLTSLPVDTLDLNYFENLQTKSDLNLEMGFDEQMVVKSLGAFATFETYKNDMSLRDIYAINFYLYWKNSITSVIEKSYIFNKNSQNSLATLRGFRGVVDIWSAIEQSFKKRLGQFYCFHFYKYLLIHTKLLALKTSNFNYFFDFYLHYKKKAILLLRGVLRGLLMRRLWIWPTWWFFLRYRERSLAWKKIKAFWLTPCMWYGADLTKLPISNLITRFKNWKYADDTNKRVKLKKRRKLVRRFRKFGWLAPAIWNNLPASFRASVRLISYTKKIQLFIRKLVVRRRCTKIKLKKFKVFAQIFYNYICDYQKQKIKILKNISIRLWTQMKSNARIRRLFKTIKFKKVKAKKNKIWFYMHKLKRLNFKCKALESDLLNILHSSENGASTNNSKKERRLVRNSWVPPAEWVLIPDKFRKKIVRNSYKKLLKRRALKKKFYRRFLWKRRNYKIINSEEYKVMIKNLKISAAKRRELTVWKNVRTFGPQTRILNKFERCTHIIARMPAITKIKSNTKNDKKIQKY